MIWEGEIDGPYFIEIHETDGYHGGTYAKLKILDQDKNICFDKNVYVNYHIYHINKNIVEDINLWKKAARDILDGDETGIWRCCGLEMTPWNPDGTLKENQNAD